MVTTKEIWISIKMYEGLYEISNIGRVKSLAREWSSYGGGKQKKPDTIMKLNIESHGYYQVCLKKDKKGRNFLVHRLVALHFIDNNASKPQVNHKNGNKLDNIVENLEWVTNGENQKHAYEIGLKKGQKGIKNVKSVLSDKEVLEIREFHEFKKYNGLELSKMYSVGSTAIYDIIHRRTWRHI